MWCTYTVHTTHSVNTVHYSRIYAQRHIRYYLMFSISKIIFAFIFCFVLVLLFFLLIFVCCATHWWRERVRACSKHQYHIGEQTVRRTNIRSCSTCALNTQKNWGAITRKQLLNQQRATIVRGGLDWLGLVRCSSVASCLCISMYEFFLATIVRVRLLKRVAHVQRYFMVCNNNTVATCCCAVFPFCVHVASR